MKRKLLFFTLLPAILFVAGALFTSVENVIVTIGVMAYFALMISLYNLIQPFKK